MAKDPILAQAKNMTEDGEFTEEFLDQMFTYKMMDMVRKKDGYTFPGVIVSRFVTREGFRRYVVECTAPGADGCLHIFNEQQLEPWDGNL